MARVRVITDSACDLKPALASEHDITIVPLSIRFGSEEFIDGETLDTAEFWRRCAASAVLPETAAPSPGAFQKAFLQAAEDGYDGVVCLNLSAELSGTHQSARTAADAVSGTIPVSVVDTRSVTMGQGLIALAAAETASSGASVEDVVAQVEHLIPRTKVYGAVDKLDHLEKGGRIGGARALLGSLLSIKPVIMVADGVVEEESKQRTRTRSLRYLADKVRAAGPISRLAICNGQATDIDEFVAMFQGIETEFPLVIVDLGPVVGTHTGPGTLGACLIKAG